MRRVLGFFCLLFSAFYFLTAACAEGIAVRKTEAHFSDGSYQLSADFDISFNFVVEQALTQGVPLYFISEFTLTRPRWYWMDETVAQSEQTIKLSYNSLTRQYRIKHGSLFQNFTSLDDALNIIRHQSALPIQTELLKKKEVSHIAAVRLHLDLTQLPKPLQVNALTGKDWSLDSDWYRWIVRPDADTHNPNE
ncbi:MAG: DUF4390 domain-containing protein [Gallionellaceae bacterium]|nr:DUF4390 domain-containing protein [Gallionellaceae bacterium]